MDIEEAEGAYLYKRDTALWVSDDATQAPPTITERIWPLSKADLCGWRF
jgi:hypothetical protein